ncbi:hypothetical protein CsSME_00003867 [Camellia sinensis var. sinensis]
MEMAMTQLVTVVAHAVSSSPEDVTESSGSRGRTAFQWGGTISALSVPPSLQTLFSFLFFCFINYYLFSFCFVSFVKFRCLLISIAWVIGIFVKQVIISMIVK